MFVSVITALDAVLLSSAHWLYGFQIAADVLCLFPHPSSFPTPQSP